MSQRWRGCCYRKERAPDSARRGRRHWARAWLFCRHAPMHGAATTQFNVKVGNTVIIPPGSPMSNFRSNTLNRTFPTIYFVNGIFLLPYYLYLVTVVIHVN